MKVTYDPEVNALKIKWGDYGAYSTSDEADHPDLILDYDKEGHVIGVELLGAKEHLTMLADQAEAAQLLPPAEVAA